MNTLLLPMTIVLVSTMVGGQTRAAANTTFPNAGQYTDVPRASYDQERVMRDLSAHFAKLAEKLPAGQDLKIEVLDLDLAGRIEYSARFMRELRVLRGGADWPHLHVRYTIEANGVVLRSGDEALADMTYLNHMNRYPSGDELRYEKKMIDDWFKAKLTPGAAR